MADSSAEIASAPVAETMHEDAANGVIPPLLEPLELQEDEGEDGEENYPTGPKLVAVMVALILSLTLIGLDNAIVSTAVPRITNYFKTTSDMGWYSSAYRLTSCAFLFMFGKIYTIASVKRVLLAAMVIFELGSLLCTVAPTSPVLVLGRAVAGLGCSGILSGNLTLLGQCFPPRRRPLAAGIGGAIEGLSSVSAPLLGGILTDKVSWRACFGINLPLGAVAMGIIFFFLQDPQPNPDMNLPLKEKLRKLDLLGTAIFVPSMTCLLVALQWGGVTYGWSDARIISLFILFGILLGVFAWLQYRQQDNATLPPRILRQRSIVAGAWYAGCCNAALAVVEYYISIYFQAVRGYSAGKSGVLLLPMIIGLCIACLCAGVTTTAIGYYNPLMFFATIVGSVASGLLTTITVDGELIRILCYQALLGFGIGMGIQAPQFAAQSILSPRELSIGVGIVQFGQGIGPAIMVTAAQSIFQSRLSADLSRYGVGGVNSTALADMGLSDIRHEIGGDNLGRILLGYDEAVTQTFYLPVALSCLTLLGAAGMEWRSIKKKRS